MVLLNESFIGRKIYCTPRSNTCIEDIPDRISTVVNSRDLL